MPCGKSGTMLNPPMTPIHIRCTRSSPFPMLHAAITSSQRSMGVHRAVLRYEMPHSRRVRPSGTQVGTERGQLGEQARGAAPRLELLFLPIMLRALPALLYVSSPNSGCPMCFACTRIWCVRPVLSFHWTSAAAPPASGSTTL